MQNTAKVTAIAFHPGLTSKHAVATLTHPRRNVKPYLHPMCIMVSPSSLS